MDKQVIIVSTSLGTFTHYVQGKNWKGIAETPFNKKLYTRVKKQLESKGRKLILMHLVSNGNRESEEKEYIKLMNKYGLTPEEYILAYYIPNSNPTPAYLTALKSISGRYPNSIPIFTDCNMNTILDFKNKYPNVMHSSQLISSIMKGDINE